MLELDARTLNFYDGTRSRVDVNATKMSFVSADGSNYCDVPNDGVHTAITKAFYLGAEDVDGSYRILDVTGVLTFQYRASGVWNTIGGFS